MIRKHLGRVAALFMSAALLGAAALAAGPVAAANPTWRVDFDRLPNVVAPGNDAGWFVTVTNDGPSNINDLNITVTSEELGDLPSYFVGMDLSSGGTESCSTATGALVCNVGTLGDDQFVTFTVAFPVPDGEIGTFDLNIGLLAGTGDTGSDGPGKSRGDKKTFTNSTPISQSPDFDGGFTADENTFSTNQNVGRRNPQASTVELVGDNIGVTISDGGVEPDPNCSTIVEDQCGRLFGQWTSLNVDDNELFDSAFRVTLLVSGSTVPGGTDTDDVVAVHVLDDGTIDVIGDDPSERCANADDSASAECVYVTKVGSNYKLYIWLFQNGGLRGGY